MKRKIIFGIVLIILIISSLFFDLIIYGFNQAKGQLRVVWNARPIEEVMTDLNFPDSLKQKIRLIQEVRRYAIDSIGLVDSDNYTTFYDQEGKTLLWNLSAAEPFALEPKLWSFPILGSFPYKGFFNFEKAKEELSDLEEKGYDARIRPVGGWSTLGWFKDPILSIMLERSEGGLAELIIHELTHSTLFVKDNIEFNENLASFIGERGAVLFLSSKYGVSSDELLEYNNSEEDSRTFIRQMLLASSKLETLYSTFDELATDSIQIWKKHLLIDKITSSLDTIPFYNKSYNDIFKNGRPNNAYFMSYIRYHSSEDSLNHIFQNQFESNLSRFIRGMKDYHE
jgi:predicted aminopeptidase